MPIRLICLEADDTLWHNMRHFEIAEGAFVDVLRPFAEAHVTRAALEAYEHRNLAIYGYGVKGFTLSMIEAALELGGDRLPAGAIADILAAGKTLLAHPVELFDGIAETLDALAGRGRVVLVTKGDLLHQEMKLAASGLGARFAGVEIVSDKTADGFAALFRRYGVEPHEAVMAGDSMRSDILPALAAGAWAAFVPHDRVWSHEAAAAPDAHPRFRVLARLAELPGWIDTLGSAADRAISPVRPDHERKTDTPLTRR